MTIEELSKENAKLRHKLELCHDEIEGLDSQIKDLESDIKDLEDENDRIKSERDELSEKVEELETNQKPNWLNVYIKESMLLGDDIDNLNQLILDYCEKYNISTTRGN